jgi:6-phosphofructokinase 1
VRSGDPDALDSIVPMAFGNLALDLILENKRGLLVAVRNGVYSSAPLDVVLEKKVVDVDLFYNTERLRPKYGTFGSRPLFVMTSQM